MSLDISTIIQKQLTAEQYYAEETAKKVVVLHHTVSNGNPLNVISGWQTNTERVATAFVIAGVEDNSHLYKDGDIYQAFSSKHWAHHLGTHFSNNAQLNKQSIGIELCNWGILTKRENKYYSFTGKEIQQDQVQVYQIPFRDSAYFHKYTTKQIENLKLLVQYLCDKYNINKAYREDIWAINNDAISGVGGIFTHCSYRNDKSDVHPQPELIAMLKTL